MDDNRMKKLENDDLESVSGGGSGSTDVMAKRAHGSIPDTVEEWPDAFNTFSINQVPPELRGLNPLRGKEGR